MKQRLSFRWILIVCSALFISPVIAVAQEASPVASPAATPPPLPSNVSVVASGFNNPRGLAFGPDGEIYVAEGGLGGTNTTGDQCEQVVPPLGPYTGDNNASISKIDPTGQVSKVVEGLPSTNTTPETGGDISGVADVAFVDGTLYYLLGGAGCSHGHADVPNGVFKVNDDGTTTLVADLSAFYMANPIAQPNAADFEPDETYYSMVEADGMLYVVGPNGGEIEKVDPSTGEITRVIDISASEGHIVPTAITAGPDGSLYFSNLGRFPVVAGDAFVYQLTADGALAVVAQGFSAVLGIAFDQQGALYVLQTSAPAEGGPLPITPNSGSLIRVGEDGTLETIVSGLTQPTALRLGPDGNLYISNFGWASPPGSGQVLKVDLSATATPGATPVA
jgi:hypothetical protein